MTEPVIVPHPNTIRGPIESEHNGIRDAREKEFVADRLDLEADYHADLATIKSNKEAAMVAAGLNPDGGIPSDYPASVPSGDGGGDGGDGGNGGGNGGGGGGTLPVNTDLPEITGANASVGTVVHCSDGTWTGAEPITFTRQWMRKVGESYSQIAGETASNYTLTTDDIGAQVMCRVHATNSVDSYQVDSALYGPVIA